VMAPKAKALSGERRTADVVLPRNSKTGVERAQHSPHESSWLKQGILAIAR